MRPTFSKNEELWASVIHAACQPVQQLPSPASSCGGFCTSQNALNAIFARCPAATSVIAKLTMNDKNPSSSHSADDDGFADPVASAAAIFASTRRLFPSLFLFCKRMTDSTFPKREASCMIAAFWPDAVIARSLAQLRCPIRMSRSWCSATCMSELIFFLLDSSSLPAPERRGWNF